MAQMTERTNGRLTSASAIGVVIIGPLTIWMLTQIAEINGNRFDATQARVMQREISDVWKAIAVVKADMAALPPDSFEAKVDDLVEKVHRLELEMNNK